MKLYYSIMDDDILNDRKLKGFGKRIFS